MAEDRDARNLQSILIEHGDMIARIDERTLIIRKEQIAQTDILSDMTVRVGVVETKQKAHDRSRSKAKRRWYGVLIVLGSGALGWIAQHIAEAVLAAL